MSLPIAAVILAAFLSIVLAALVVLIVKNNQRPQGRTEEV